MAGHTRPEAAGEAASRGIAAVEVVVVGAAHTSGSAGIGAGLGLGRRGAVGPGGHLGLGSGGTGSWVLYCMSVWILQMAILRDESKSLREDADLNLARVLRFGSQEYGKIVAQKRVQIVENTCRIAALVVTNLLASPFWRYLFEIVLKMRVVVLMFVDGVRVQVPEKGEEQRMQAESG